MKRAALLLILFLIPVVYGCSPVNRGPVLTDDPESIQYTQKMKQGAIHEGWSKTYFGSFQQTNQKEYLQLAAKHSISAIDLYAGLEKQLAGYTLERYDALVKRREVCAFFHRLSLLAKDNLVVLEMFEHPACVR